MKDTTRRKFFRGAPVAAAAAGLAATPAKAQDRPAKRVIYRNGRKPEKPPLFNGTVAWGNLIFVAGVGYHQEGDIKVHTEHVLEQIKQQLESAGSSMEKVLKCNVYLHDLKDYAGMNEVFQGKFGPEPPVRTTIAAPGGIPGDSLVEIDVIACIKTSKAPSLPLKFKVDARESQDGPLSTTEQYSVTARCDGSSIDTDDQLLLELAEFEKNHCDRLRSSHCGS